jgi:hypothetical protein
MQIQLPWTHAVSARLCNAKTGRMIPCQVERSGNGLTLHWLVDNLKAGDTQQLRVEPCDEPANAAVRFDDDAKAGKVDVYISGKLFTAYHYGPQWVRPFLYPVIGPYGARVTRGYPVDKGAPVEAEDHPHHKSIWVAYGECGRVDNWSEEPGHGWQVHRKFVTRTPGPVFGRLVAKNDWVSASRKKQFEETREFRFFALPNGERLFDVGIAFRMSEGPVTFRDTKEGGLVSVRVATSMDVRNGGTIQNGYGGIDEAETWGQKAPWCDYSGDVDGRRVGIALMDNPDNPRYPTEWHVRDYGLMTANCFAQKCYRPERKEKGDMAFPKGSTTKWRYRILVHKGDASKGKVGTRFMDYVSPPAVRVE